MQRDYLSEYNFTGRTPEAQAKAEEQQKLEAQERRLDSGLSEYGYSLEIGRDQLDLRERGYKIVDRSTGKAVAGANYRLTIWSVEAFLKNLEDKGRQQQAQQSEADRFLDLRLTDAMIHDLNYKYGADLLIGSTYRQAFATVGKRMAEISEVTRFLYGLYEAAEG